MQTATSRTGFVRSLLLMLTASALVACGGSKEAPVMLTGAGATFPNPIYSKWFNAFYEATGTQVNYQSLGSGAGVKQFSEGTVDFGATDGPMTDAEIAAVNGKVIHLPTVLGADAVTWNLPSLGKTTLNFDAATLADIFLGKITKWNHPRLVALNPGVALPDKDLLVVHRTDGSGTTFIWTDYLSTVSPEWARWRIDQSEVVQAILRHRDLRAAPASRLLQGREIGRLRGRCAEARRVISPPSP